MILLVNILFIFSVLHPLLLLLTNVELVDLIFLLKQLSLLFFSIEFRCKRFFQIAIMRFGEILPVFHHLEPF